MYKGRVWRVQIRFARTYVACIDQPCMHLVLWFVCYHDVMMVADCTNAFANFPSPTQPTYVRFDEDANADWYRCRHGKELRRLLVQPVLKALHGDSLTGARSSTTSISCTPHINEVSTEVRMPGRSPFCTDKSTTSLSLAPTLL